MTNTEIITAYRQLYRALLRAVQYKSPQRHVVLDQLRASFRDTPATAPPWTAANGLGAGVFDPVAVKRMRWFLTAAAVERGLESQILRNLIGVKIRDHARDRSWRRTVINNRQKDEFYVKGEKNAAMGHYEMTLAMLNQTMGVRFR